MQIPSRRNDIDMSFRPWDDTGTAAKDHRRRSLPAPRPGSDQGGSDHSTGKNACPNLWRVGVEAFGVPALWFQGAEDGLAENGR